MCVCVCMCVSECECVCVCVCARARARVRVMEHVPQEPLSPSHTYIQGPLRLASHTYVHTHTHTHTIIIIYIIFPKSPQHSLHTPRVCVCVCLSLCVWLCVYTSHYCSLHYIPKCPQHLLPHTYPLFLFLTGAPHTYAPLPGSSTTDGLKQRALATHS